MVSLRVVKHGTGIHLTYGEISIALDTGLEGNTTLLSHAHSDHIGGLDKARQIVTTKGTYDALQARGGKITSKASLLKYNETLGQIGIYISALNAGHVIGSAMYKIEFEDGLTVLYTGDFNVVDSVVHEAAIPVEVDVLITEATYGSPQWVFPDRKRVHKDIIETATSLIEVGKIPLFQAYSLGKAQEAIALLTYSGISTISGNPAIDAISDVYSAYGQNLKYISIESEEARNALKEGCAIVTSHPSHTMSNVKRSLGTSFYKDLTRRAEKYNLSGWTLGELKNGGFPLSAHSDFPGLLRFAEQVNPRVVYCFTNNASTLSSYLAKKGINAVPLE
ncbi:MAG: MBL fold metallo-hydrolase [Candidatus Thorarchaeota archaeon]